MRPPVLRLKLIFQLYTTSHIILFTSGQYAGPQIQCFSCSSHIDPACARGEPRVTITCPIDDGRGCATKIHQDGRVEKGCSQNGLNPAGCEISEMFGTECVCHNDLCNEGMPVHHRVKEKDEGPIECYFCDSKTNPWCGFDLPDNSNIPTQTCPAHGCYYTKRVDGGEMLYHRLCFDDGGPATYYPSGCYTVYNDQTSTSSEICVCYENLCNKNSRSVYASSADKEENTKDNGSATNASLTALTLMLGMLISLLLYCDI